MRFSEINLDSVDGVYAVLQNLHAIRTYSESQSDYYATDILADIELAIQNVKLSKRQREILDLVFEQELTQCEASEVLGISQQAVSQHINTIVQRVADYEWGKHRGNRI